MRSQTELLQRKKDAEENYQKEYREKNEVERRKKRTLSQKETEVKANEKTASRRY